MRPLLLLLFLIVFGQPHLAARTDSLEAALSSTAQDTSRINILLELASSVEGTDRARSFLLTQEALALATALESMHHKGRCLNYLGDLYWFAGDYSTASRHYFDALHIYEKLNRPTDVAKCYRNIGWIYQGQGNYEQTLYYYKKSLELNKKLNNKRYMIANYDDLGIVYKLMGRFDEALENCQITIALAKEIGSKRGVATAYGNLGSIYFDMKLYDLAIESYQYALRADKGATDHYNHTVAYSGIGECYTMRNQPEKSLPYLNKALDIAKEQGFRFEIAQQYRKLAAAYAKMNDHKKAYENFGLYQSLRDSVYNEQNSRQINEMSVKYESEKKALMIKELEQTKNLSELQLNKAHSLKIYVSLFCLLTAGLAALLLRSFIRKKRTNSRLASAYNEIELRNAEITESINYSQRIQEASLPPRELKYRIFPNAFVYFQPKDIVSGDFYWFSEKNGAKIIAACDCTGHGVPGALMSMVGNNLLQQIVNQKGIVKPAMILNELHTGIRKALKQEDSSRSTDGMDISILSFQNNEVYFAGAQRPLWIVREAEVIEIKGDKLSIGGTTDERPRVFTEHRVDCHPGDCLYIFSDGYVDQFGGADGKKFMSRNFKKLLTSIYTEPVAMQEQIAEQTFHRWKGSREQVDDVLVIGIKI